MRSSVCPSVEKAQASLRDTAYAFASVRESYAQRTLYVQVGMRGTRYKEDFRRQFWDVHNNPWAFGVNHGSSAQQGRSGSLTGFPSLPGDCAQGEHDRPCSDPFRPSKEFVPPWQVVLSASSFFFAGYLLFRRNKESGAIFCAVSFILFGGTMLLVGHERYPDYQGNYPRYPPPCTEPNLHDPKIVPQNILTTRYCWGTVIT